MIADIPANEEERLKVLYEYNILDTPCELVFDQITELASIICATPISALSLIDRDRQWFKAIKGLDVKETSRDVAFCAHTILHDNVLIINDPETHPSFRDNPLVQGEPKIRFYAGAPLRTPEGVNIGSLCVIDQQRKDISDGQVRDLELLASIAMKLFVSRKQLSENNQQIKKYISHIKEINKELKTKLLQEQEITNLFQIFNHFNDVLLSSKSLDEALAKIEQYRSSLFPLDTQDHKDATKNSLSLKTLQELTERERQVLRYHVVGYSTKRIAQLLSISDKTVARHIENICKKLHCRYKNELIILTFKSGFFMELVAGREGQSP